MGDDWKAREVTLKFKLGEITLRSVRLPFIVLDRHFTALGTDLARHRPNGEIEARGVRGALIRSHPIEGELPQLTRADGHLLYVPRQYPRFFIDMKGTFDGYLKKFSGKTRSTLGRRVRKFAEHSGGKNDFRSYKTEAEIEEFFRLAIPLSKRTYQDRLLDAGLPDTPEYKAGALERARTDSVRAFLLFHEGRPVAYLYCPVQEGRVLEYAYLGYDPDYAKFSVGTVLQHLALEQLFAEDRFEMFDFTEGAGDHKKLFSTGSVQCADLWYFRPTPKNELLVRSHLALGRVSRELSQVAEKTQVKAKLKRIIRARA